MTKSQESQIRRAFTLQSLTEAERDTCEALVYAHRSLALRVAEVCPQSRECNLALRCLEEACDWSKKAVVRYPKELV